MLQRHIIAGLLVVTACGTTQEPAAPAAVESQEEAIIGGVNDPGDPEVFGMFIFGNNNAGAGCTATLIDSRTLLTAAHCVDPRTIGATAVQLWVHNKPSENQASQADLIRVVETRMHPGWQGQGENDIAMALLATAPSGVTPKPWNSSSINTFAGQPIRAIGYGATVGGANPSGSGTRKQVALTFRMIFQDIFFLGDNVGKGVCHGDSGGPSFHTFGDGVERVVGVHSFTTNEACVSGADTRVDYFAPFIRQWLTDKEGPSCAEDGRCKQGCSTPDIDCLCAADGQCTAACPNVSKDPDCPVNCGMNGICALETCPARDVDCIDNGMLCGNDNQCPGRKCVRDNQHVDSYCSVACTSNAQCWSGAECDTALGYCRYTYVPETQVGDICTPLVSFCALNSRCAGPTPDYAYCSWACTTQADCQNGSTCATSFDGSKYCQAPPKPAIVMNALGFVGGDSATCSSAGGLLPMLALLLLRRRRNR